MPKASEEIERTLAAWPADPTPAERRRLAILFLAANDRGSAAVQWLRLPASERRAGDGLPDAMVEIIARRGKPPNENYAIGAALAARLGLERVYEVDDHTADTPVDDAYMEALKQVWSPQRKPPILAAYLKRQTNLRTSSDLIGFYRFLNDPATQRAGIAADMGAAAQQRTETLYGRQYLSWWETRNLRMIANIRAAFGKKPDARVLVIVGSTHKGYFDAYLDLMQDVRLVDVMPFLK